MYLLNINNNLSDKSGAGPTFVIYLALVFVDLFALLLVLGCALGLQLGSALLLVLGDTDLVVHIPGAGAKFVTTTNS